MPERDPLERRGFVSLTPTDLEDPAQFGQVTETIKDAVVELVRSFFNQPNLNVTEPERRREIPTVRKYAVGFGPGTDPYETVQQIVQEFADVDEALPHAAVTAVQGKNDPLTLGQPFIAHIQNPPRINSTVAEPYALGGSLVEERTVTITAAVVSFRYVATLEGQDFAYVAQAGDTVQDVAAGLRDSLRAAEPFFRIARSGATVTVLHGEANTAFTLAVLTNMSTALIQAAGVAPSDTLVFRTTPSRRGDTPVTETIELAPDRFPPAAPVTAALAADVARVINERARFAFAETVDVGGTPGVRLYPGGPRGGRVTPNEIEILPETSDNLLTALGLGTRATGVGGDTLTGTPPDTSMTLSTAGVGTAAGVAVPAGVTAYVHISGAPTAANNGRFAILTVPGANSITLDNPAGIAESFNGATWFIGLRDDWRNPARPVSNRRHLSFSATATVSVLAEDPNQRTELHDLILSQFCYYLEIQHFEVLGRGVLDYDNFPDEVYQISLAKEVTHGGDANVARPDDQKGQVYESRVAIPIRLVWYQDRPVLVPFGPSVGESWVITGADVTRRDNGTVNNDFDAVS